MIPISYYGLQGFYVTLVYHGISIAYGGDSAIHDKDAWITDWVSLVKQVLKSDACEVKLACKVAAQSSPAFGQMAVGLGTQATLGQGTTSLATQADRSTIARAM